MSLPINLASHTFGAEFEVLVPFGFDRDSTARELTRLSGVAVSGRVPYGTNAGWKIVTDGSVHGPGVPLEIVSPVLSGDSGIAQVSAVCNALRSLGATVNASCGFHVHVGARGEQLGFFKNLVKLYARFEDALDSIMPQSRRGNGATYCKSVKLVSSQAVEQATSVSQLARDIARASGAAGTRYHKVNLEAHSKHGTVEFRQHGGTVEASKAVNWIVTCLKLVAAAKAGKTGEETAQFIAWDLHRLTGKARDCASLIARPQGATNAEIRAAFGYRTISARTQLKRSGLAFREARDSVTGKVRFHAIGGAETVTAPAVPATIDGLADLLEADEAQRAFFAERRAAVRG